jgi:UDP-N-acetylglucosamine 2-epimerase (non-hydrolysing)
LPKKILCIVGTRPEAIKMAPVIRAFRQADWAETVVLSTGQHREILHQTLGDFGLSVDIDLQLMQQNQSLGALTARIFEHLDPVLGETAADLVLAQGDTTTVMVASVLSFYRRILFGHVEAGLRTFDLENPFPEEFNRVVTGRIAAVHFAPTAKARDNLLAEGIAAGTVHVTGNTVIDALLDTAGRVEPAPMLLEGTRRLVLVTAHRRENFGEPIRRICAALRRLHEQFPDVTIVYPVHPNPNINDVVRSELAGLDRVVLSPPVGYREMVGLLKAADLILTDSGGLQEEAPALAKPVLVLRDATERPEAVDAGVVKLVGTDPDLIATETSRLLTDDAYYASVAKGVSPYGDGLASGRIVSIARDLLQA